MKLNQKGFIHLFTLLIVTLILISGFGYYTYKNYYLPSKNEFTGLLNTPESDPVNQDISYWNAFISQEYDFTLKYPSEWEVTEESGIMHQSKLSQSYYFHQKDTDPHKNESVSVSIIFKVEDSAYPHNDPHAYFDKLYKKEVKITGDETDETKLANIIVDTYPAVKTYYTTPRRESAEPTINQDILIYKDPYLFIIQAHQGGRIVVDENHLKIFNQILSTFEFIE